MGHKGGRRVESSGRPAMSDAQPGRARRSSDTRGGQLDRHGYPAQVDPRTQRWIVPGILALLVVVVVIGALLG